MTNKERVEKFKNEKIAIHCETEEEAKSFVNWCYLNGMRWGGSKPTKTFYDINKNDTCYTFNFTGDNYLEYSCKQFYKDEGWKIIKYKDFMKEEGNKMTNLEWLLQDGSFNMYADNLKEYGEIRLKVRTDKLNKMSKECGAPWDIIPYLLKEHKESVKLTQFEFDLLKAEYESFGDARLTYCNVLHNLKNKGYFKGVEDTTMTLKEILDNCEVKQCI